MTRRARKTEETSDASLQTETSTNPVETPFDPFDTGTEFDPATLEAATGALTETAASVNETTRQAARRPSEAGRGWTQRYEQPVAYRRFTLRDQHGAEKILFTFNLPKGQSKPDDEVIDVLRDHKFWKDGRPNGLADDARTDPESYSTGLQFGVNAKFPKAWVLPNNAHGREVADSIDQALQQVANRMEAAVATVG